MKLVVSFEVEIETDDIIEAVQTAIEISEDPRMWQVVNEETGDSYTLVEFNRGMIQ